MLWDGALATVGTDNVKHYSAMHLVVKWKRNKRNEGLFRPCRNSAFLKRSITLAITMEAHGAAPLSSCPTLDSWYFSTIGWLARNWAMGGTTWRTVGYRWNNWMLQVSSWFILRSSNSDVQRRKIYAKVQNMRNNITWICVGGLVVTLSIKKLWVRIPSTAEINFCHVLALRVYSLQSLKWVPAFGARGLLPYSAGT